MSMHRRLSGASALLLLTTAALAETPDLGRSATPEEIAVWDISIGPDVVPESGDEVVAGRGLAIVAGLVNGHGHAAMTLLRGYGDGSAA